MMFVSKIILWKDLVSKVNLQIITSSNELVCGKIKNEA